MFGKLKNLATAKENEEITSSFIERFTFFRHREKREQCIRKLETWVKNLERLTKQAETGLAQGVKDDESKHNTGKTGICIPPVHLRDLIASLYSVFEAHCRCSCAEAHEVKLCLKESYGIAAQHQSLDLDFLVSGYFGACSPQAIRWQEGNVMVTSQR